MRYVHKGRDGITGEPVRTVVSSTCQEVMVRALSGRELGLYIGRIINLLKLQFRGIGYRDL